MTEVGAAEGRTKEALDVDLVLSLIRREGTFDLARRHLRKLELEHTAANWDDLIDRRLRPAIAQAQMSQTDVLSMLAEMEEYGRQHVFLFRLRPGAQEALFSAPVSGGEPLAQVAGFPSLLGPAVIDLPPSPRVVAVRQDNLPRGASVTVKIVERRVVLEKEGEREHRNRRIITYKQTPYRAVNVIRIHADGVVEVRIFSERERSTNYYPAVASMLKMTPSLVRESDRVPLSLGGIRAALWDPTRRHELGAQFVFRHSRFRNSIGSQIDVAMHPVDGDLLADEDLVAGVDRFRSDPNDAYCARASVIMRQVSGGEGASRDLSINFAGEDNEFSLPERLDGTEYDNILSYILDMLGDDHVI